jgi:hypothetical protein
VANFLPSLRFQRTATCGWDFSRCLTNCDLRPVFYRRSGELRFLTLSRSSAGVSTNCDLRQIFSRRSDKLRFGAGLLPAFRRTAIVDFPGGLLSAFRRRTFDEFRLAANLPPAFRRLAICGGSSTVVSMSGDCRLPNRFSTGTPTDSDFDSRAGFLPAFR